jgi:hypothetical protein
MHIHLRNRRSLVTVAVLALSACAAAPDGAERTAERGEAITNGIADDGDLGVVALLWPGDERPRCTGTLVAPRVVVTAAHCETPAPPTAVFFGADPTLGGTTVAVLDARAEPGFDPVTLVDDLAVVLLAAPAAVTPWPLWMGPPEALAPGAPLRLVGFGATAASDRAPPRKHAGTATVAAVAAATFSFQPDPAQTCRGDSGGPAFLTAGGTEYLVGVTSYGDPACAAGATDTRVDRYRAFVQGYVAETSPSAAAAGDRCFYPGQCRAGACLAPPEAPHFAYCAPPCRGADDCPSAMTCTGDPGATRCVFPSPPPGALGASCATHADCESAVCAEPRADAPAVCAVFCDPHAATACPTGYRCTTSAAPAHVTACFAAPRAGCAITDRGPADGPRAMALAWILCGFVRRRRRRVRAASP